MERRRKTLLYRLESDMTRITAARIRYCGHDASFVADVYDFGDSVTLHSAPIDLDTICRPAGDVD
jgi:hypothetical protein